MISLGINGCSRWQTKTVDLMGDVTAKLNLPEFNRALVKFQVDTEMGWPEVIRIQAKAMLKRLLDWTAPKGINKAAQKQGKAKVEQDVRRVFTAFEHFEFRDLGIQRAWEEGDQETLEKIFKNSPKLSQFTLLHQPKEEIHEAARRRGRVPRRNKARHVIMGKGRQAGARLLDRYITKRMKRVGRAMAGWIRAASHLSEKFPAWIRKSGGALEGGVRDETRNRIHPRIIMTNTVDYISELVPGSMQSALIRSRIRDMEKHAKKLIRARARKRGFKVRGN